MQIILIILLAEISLIGLLWIGCALYEARQDKAAKKDRASSSRLVFWQLGLGAQAALCLDLGAFGGYA